MESLVSAMGERAPLVVGAASSFRPSTPHEDYLAVLNGTTAFQSNATTNPIATKPKPIATKNGELS
jgi:hypothetical protein